MHYLLPYIKWGMGILNPFLKENGKYKFISVLIDYFTKRVEVEEVASIIEKEMLKVHMKKYQYKIRSAKKGNELW